MQQDILEQVIENGGEDITKEQLYDILKEHFGKEQVPELYNEDGTENEKWVNFPKNFPKLKIETSDTHIVQYADDVINEGTYIGIACYFSV